MYNRLVHCTWTSRAKTCLVPTTQGTTRLKTKRLNAEIANGRLSMMAIIGLFLLEVLTGSVFSDWALSTDGPLLAFVSEPGVLAPVGYFAVEGGDEVLFRRRVTEFNSGLICMLATLGGYLTPELTGKPPGYLSFSTGPKFTEVQYSSDFGGNMPFPGNYGFKPPLLSKDDPESKTKCLNAVIANGRLGLKAIIGMFFQDGLTGSAYGDWALYADSPLRDFESELGVQAPVGYWDPLGLAADGDVEVFTRRRVTEIKHDRISMLAARGQHHPRAHWKAPRLPLPLHGSEVHRSANCLGAISKVPADGWAQLGAYTFFCEYSSEVEWG